MNIISAAVTFGCSFPFSGNVIFVPFFQPGWISIVSISSAGRVFLQTHAGEIRLINGYTYRHT
jgi:hypothetical protein